MKERESHGCFYDFLVYALQQYLFDISIFYFLISNRVIQLSRVELCWKNDQTFYLDGRVFVISRMLERGEVFPLGNLSGTREELNILRFKNVCTPNVYYDWFVPRFFAFLANEEWFLSAGTLPLPPCDGE